ncbi:Asp23/Gls24 family envelope stress response protein [Streptomyces sp. NPDC048290]|uniref:Asp23/Gls24 family envelope stress response protein n=1 Tax=Streptomyces sp. NPDC048290 TaxID=3155811 RepID=UPI0034443E28
MAVSQSEKAVTDRNKREKDGLRGTTTIADGVVSAIAGIAIRETDGVFSVGRGAAKALGAVTGRMPGTSSADRSVKVEVGRKQTAIDADVQVEYGVPIRELSNDIRANVTDAVETMTGLEVVEVNINVFDVHTPEDDGGGSGEADTGRVR